MPPMYVTTLMYVMTVLSGEGSDRRPASATVGGVWARQQ